MLSARQEHLFSFKVSSWAMLTIPGRKSTGHTGTRPGATTNEDLNSQEYQELQEAINTLSEDGIISPDDAAFEAVINSKNIKTYA